MTESVPKTKKVIELLLPHSFCGTLSSSPEESAETRRNRSYKLSFYLYVRWMHGYASGVVVSSEAYHASGPEGLEVRVFGYEVGVLLTPQKHRKN